MDAEDCNQSVEHNSRKRRQNVTRRNLLISHATITLINRQVSLQKRSYGCTIVWLFAFLGLLQPALVLCMCKVYIGSKCIKHQQKCDVSRLLAMFEMLFTKISDALQHTATYCNILQHTATYCKILQDTATYCDILQHTATYFNILQHIAKFWSTLKHTATHYNTLQYTATHCTALQHSAMAIEGRGDQGVVVDCSTLHTATYCNALHQHCNTPHQHTATHCRVAIKDR